MSAMCFENSANVEWGDDVGGFSLMPPEAEPMLAQSCYARNFVTAVRDESQQKNLVAG